MRPEEHRLGAKPPVTGPGKDLGELLAGLQHGSDDRRLCHRVRCSKRCSRNMLQYRRFAEDRNRLSR
jgi:hypothetical protein